MRTNSAHDTPTNLPVVVPKQQQGRPHHRPGVSAFVAQRIASPAKLQQRHERFAA
jgi:hypothetical protein